MTERDLGPFWSNEPDELAAALRSGVQGLTSAEVEARLRDYGPNALDALRPLSRVGVLLNQVRSPLLLLLIFAAAASGLTGEWFDAGIVLTIVVATVAVGYSREYGAQVAADALRARVHVRTQVVRDGRVDTIDTRGIVPGDLVLLSAGCLVPADARIIEANDFFVSEAVLTGESFPVQKQPGVIDARSGLAERTNCVFLGTNVRSGTARCLVTHTGAATEFGAIASRLMLRPPETEFDRGIRHFGYLLSSVMLILVVVVFTAHALQGRAAVETLLFAIALAVGLSPELLPAILSVNLTRGARMLAHRGVLVRRLNAIENLGSMDILCTDKTGTLTEGVIRVEGAYDSTGAPSSEVLELAARNAALETGLDNPLDEAILNARRPDLSGVHKLAEIPFDFVRKRVTVAIRDAAGARLIIKGAFHHVLEVCTRTEDCDALDADRIQRLEACYEEWSHKGIRVLAVAARAIPEQQSYSRDDERDMTFMGFLTFLDQPKEGVADAIAHLSRLGVSLKLITGDNALVARHVAGLVGLSTERVLTGHQLDKLHDEALWHTAEKTDLFAEVDPNQKERIILALKKMGHVVGFLGDGVNDAPAMHAADTSLSVEQAVDVAREAADFVLLERGLDVIRRGVEEGRRTFANTLKYVLITTSANLGNMIGILVSAVSAVARRSDPAEQLPVGHPCDRPGRRPCRPRDGRTSAPLEHSLHRTFHAGIRARQLSVRPSHVWAAPDGVSSRPRAIPDRLVRRVAPDRARDRTRGPHPTPILPQPAGTAAAGLYARPRHGDVRDSIPALRLARRLRPTLAAVTRDDRSGHAGVCRCYRADEGLVLPRTPLTSDANGDPRTARVRLLSG